jgi:hypothetical protein
MQLAADKALCTTDAMRVRIGGVANFLVAHRIDRDDFPS